MKRKVFYSFHYAKDSWRAGQVRNIGVVEGDEPLTSNKWEEVKQKGDANILKWIQDSLVGKSCLVVLIGEKTAERKWCNREIEEGILAFHDKRIRDLMDIKIFVDLDGQMIMRFFFLPFVMHTIHHM